jgi:hypothetical protein
MKRVLLLLPTTGYRNNDFLAAANKLGVEFASGSSRLNTRASARGFGLVYQCHDRRQDRSVVACGCGDAVCRSSMRRSASRAATSILPPRSTPMIAEFESNPRRDGP